jgi:hypothetical protein
VNQGTLSHTVNGAFYVCIGNSSVTTYQSTATSTWNSGFAAALHLANGSALSVTDSTGKNSPSNSGATAAVGQIDGAAAFNGSNQTINLGSGSALNLTGNMTAEGWVNLASNSYTYGGYLANAADSLGDGAGQLGVAFGRTNGCGSLTVGVGTILVTWSNACISSSGAATVGTGAWHLIAAVRSGTSGNWTSQIYLDGAIVTTTTGITTNPTSAQEYDIGGLRVAACCYLQGSVDEVRIANVALSADWITAEYNMEKPSQTMVTLGPRVALGGPRGAQIVELEWAIPTRGLH